MVKYVKPKIFLRDIKLNITNLKSKLEIITKKNDKRAL